MGKELLTELKFVIFKNWLDTRPKMETHEPRVYPTILGGVSRGFWSPFLDLDAQSAICWHLKTGTFGKKKSFSDTLMNALLLRNVCLVVWSVWHRRATLLGKRNFFILLFL